MIQKFFLNKKQDSLAWDVFRASNPDVKYIDRLDEQIAELFEVEHPEIEPKTISSVKGLADFQKAYFEKQPESTSGVWVYLPWRKTAVRLLPPEEFFRVRTARNRNIITEQAQQTFRKCVVGLAGLSIGHAVAVTLAMQGGAEELVLADFDTVSLSNLNRLQVPVADIGANKAVLTAQRVYELNPYSHLRVFSKGLTKKGLVTFFDGPPKINVVVEAVDNFARKWEIREEARKRAVPVIMATCMGEKVLLDVERYDQNQKRKLFVKDLSSDFYDRVQKTLTRKEWIQAATEIVGVNDTESVVSETNEEIGKTVTTRPILGGTVIAMGAVVAKAIRSIALGDELADGRHEFNLTPALQKKSGNVKSFSTAAKSSKKLAPSIPWDMSAWERALVTRPASYWEELGERRALKHFHLAAERVPAYRDFLRKHNIDHSKISTIGDFKKNVPEVAKDSYLLKYPLRALCIDGKLGRSHMISTSSGSTGKPFYWPRGKQTMDEGAFIHEFIFRNAFQIHKKSTLVLVCFSMGSWIAGTYTKESVDGFSQRGYELNIVTPGIELDDIVSFIHDLHGQFDQIVLAGYPPILKDVVDAISKKVLSLLQDRIRLLFAGEGFSEQWRQVLLNKVGAKHPLHSSATIYGTADAGVMGHETVLTNAIRSWCSFNTKSSEQIFNDERLPSLTQYHPYFKYAETNDANEILFTTNAGFPLIRYNLNDVGGVVSHENFLQQVTSKGCNVREELNNDGMSHKIWRLPFIYLFGRKQLATSIYAVNIYLENIHSALAHPEIKSMVSGKAVMGNEHDENWDQYWWVNVEAASGVKLDEKLEAKITNTMVDALCSCNAEFRRLYTVVGERAVPRVSVREFGSTDFTVKNKLSWTG